MATEATSGKGLALLQAEMARQGADAAASLSSNGTMAAELAASIGRTGRLVLIGMGASHYANRMVETSWRRLGVDCRAETAGDVLLQELPLLPQTIVLISQSGESGEILQLLDLLPRGADLFRHDAGATEHARAQLAVSRWHRRPGGGLRCDAQPHRHAGPACDSPGGGRR
ncbi:hypothetical protein ACHMW4_06180 [Mesorhizobium sp. UC22_110]|uniref:hypothetical protein n=1 Tax=Mesorhizobium sp. UC22_110 TaxID=3374552 RepID=UPI003757F9C4